MSVVVTVRASVERRVRWFAAAAARGLDFSEWARRALDDQALLEAALDRERRDSEGGS